MEEVLSDAHSDLDDYQVLAVALDEFFDVRAEVASALEKVDPDDEETFRWPAEALRRLQTVHARIRDDLSALADDLEGEFCATMPWTRRDIPEVGRVEIRANTTRKWDHERLLGVVLSRARDQAVDTETGEIQDPLAVAEDLLLKVAAFSYWRLGNLRADLGIDGANYSETTYGRKRAKFSG